MPPPNKRPSLPAGLLKQLGIDAPPSYAGRRGYQPRARKEQRKELRSKKPGQAAQSSQERRSARPNGPQSQAKQSQRRQVSDLDEDSTDGDDDDEDGFGGFGESDGESDDDEGSDGNDRAPETSLSRRMREKLDKDDAEIAELERKLGMKNRKTLPKSFQEDGLGDLLESLGGGVEDEETISRKKRKAEAEEWLRSKRNKTRPDVGRSGSDDESNNEDGSDFDGLEDDEDEDDDDDDDDSVDGGGEDADEADAETRRSHKQAPRQRENPYVAPVSASASQKYVPPARRAAQAALLGSEPEELQRIRRQAHHLVARLSDANMLTMVAEVEKLYLDHPRQFVTEAVVDKLLEQILIEGALSNNVTMLIAGFATAVYTVKGTDFGGYFVQRSASLFKEHYDVLAASATASSAGTDGALRAPTSKKALNLFALLAELYNFRMLGPNLIYDYIRALLNNLSELDTELLLRVIETSGHRLRQDDPRSLGDIIALIQPAVQRAGGEKTLSARTRHMIQRINDLKKSEKKKTRGPDGNGLGYSERIFKMLGMLSGSRKVEATGPLRVSLEDIEQAGTRGKWWLVGAGWAGRGGDEKADEAGEGEGSTATVAAAEEKEPRREKTAAGRGEAGRGGAADDDVLGSWGDVIPDVEELNQLAREQGMNTDARRSIFVTLLSAADSKDAQARLLRLGLNKYDKREVANVVLRCVGSEEHFNRYYALVARQVCGADRRMGWVFQTCLWKLFRRMGEPLFGDTGDEDEADEEDEATDMRRLVNTAKMYGCLIAWGCLGLAVLKSLNLVRLQAKTRMFVEVLLLTLFEEARKADRVAGGSKGSGATLKRLFRAVRGSEDLRRGLQFFLRKTMSRSDLADKSQRAAVAKACARAQKALGGDGPA